MSTDNNNNNNNNNDYDSENNNNILLDGNATRTATASFVLPYTASIANSIEQLEADAKSLFSLHSMFSNQLHRLQLEEVALKKQLANENNQ
ncbi:hypothetical protein PPL_03216 [Heterostelium album PN500]|uniref:Uncharacterized protein n=1 Tax=Heterostelium pallidum (strain ATCC 26659 / Pp 5 / PN500) TaxID=670386 RepID=D3B494_HETP5|nr:hypothetical protein PPL_03216 [Heterostelium album PN500]EFA84142.1 hypothetical protein PPL_03216 [Heterostelium album PN500]|eukprot:XP_020436259.1 hypothetical protein PPL_03216 [Heterostelium album PN500]